MKFFSAAAAFFIIFAVYCHPANAQELQQEQIIRELEKIQREQQETIKQTQPKKQFKEEEEKKKEPEAIEQPASDQDVLKGTKDCIKVDEIILVGSTIFSTSLKEKLTAPYINRCLTTESIERLLGDIVKAYLDKGYIAARPYLQNQDLNSGKLEILVLEGNLEEIILKDKNKHSLNIKGAFPWLEGKPLNIRDIEQGLVQINRLASNKATMDVGLGTSPGDSIITISNDPSFPLHGSISYNNLGSPSISREQATATISADNPLRINDFFSYSHTESITGDREKFSSVADSFFYSVPFGYWLFTGTYSHSEYTTTISPPGGELKASGKSEQWRTQLDWIAYNGRKNKLTLSAALNHKVSKNYLAEQLLEVASRELTILDSDIKWEYRFGSGATFNLGLGYSDGIKALDALEDPDFLPETYPHAQGDKIRYTASLNITINKCKAQFTSSLTGQYAIEPLYGSEHILIGGYYTVRGFDQSNLSGDRGYYVRNEFSADLFTIPKTDILVKPFLGIDFGYLDSYPKVEYLPDVLGGTLAGMAGGVRLDGKHINGELSVGQSISSPTGLDKESPRLNATVSVSF